MPYFPYSPCVIINANDIFLVLVKKFEKIKYLTPDMATILIATSTAGKKRIKPSFVATKQVMDKVEKVSKRLLNVRMRYNPLQRTTGRTR